ncbi:uncharacterized protein LOC133500588 isoform X1 [Syngnathoides biaculeatus]|uniref:uncharacterized protein LOC133500588 isoform X1 n=1 Tax=Syngnathoides biaculeatus TaxID=300417 RepID=UPI002ADDFA5E|nr:uncharacterized protein LOC133500588 isoform X1 [Syngnathoides biaculeatus]
MCRSIEGGMEAEEALEARKGLDNHGAGAGRQLRLGGLQKRQVGTIQRKKRKEKKSSIHVTAFNVSWVQRAFDRFCTKNEDELRRLCNPCEEGWLRFESHCYLINDAESVNRKTWEDARRDCSENNSQLLVVENAGEMLGQLGHPQLLGRPVSRRRTMEVAQWQRTEPGPGLAKEPRLPHYFRRLVLATVGSSPRRELRHLREKRKADGGRLLRKAAVDLQEAGVIAVNGGPEPPTHPPERRTFLGTNAKLACLT